jgi:acyl carrier protein
MEQIYDRLTSAFHDVFDDDTIKLTPDLTAADIPEWDSLNHIRLIIAVQKRFGVSFSAAEVSELKNVGDLAELIERKWSAP